jgi:putative glutamine amidotransferase
MNIKLRYNKIMKPKIALLTRINDQRFTVNIEYVNALKNANADVVLLLPQNKESLFIELNRCDGLVIPGGEDVNPKLYSQENLYSYPIDQSIEQLDLDTIEIMDKLDKPIFGICRGLQILNVAFGGTLIQDINQQIPNSQEHSFSHIHQKPLNGHNVNVLHNTKLIDFLKPTIEVNTYHHQCIDKLASKFMVSALSDDGIIEAIESERIIAVQWHPERMCSIDEFQGLFNEFVNMCKI